MHPSTLLRHLGYAGAAIVFGTVGLHGQSFTTGTLNLRNGQPATVSLQAPAAGVTPHTLVLPPTAGVVGQVLGIDAVAGGTATMAWTTPPAWYPVGNTVVDAGVGAGQTFLGTTNEADVVVATAGTERLRLVGTAGTNQGWLGIGTTAPSARVDIVGDLALSSDGVAAAVRWHEPLVDGRHSTAIRAQAQASDITYTLPAAAPTADGHVLTATADGTMAWAPPVSGIGRGTYRPAVADFRHTIPVAGFALQADDVVMVQVRTADGASMGATVTAVDPVARTIAVETSAVIGVADAISWLVLPQ